MDAFELVWDCWTLVLLLGLHYGYHLGQFSIIIMHLLFLKHTNTIFWDKNEVFNQDVTEAAFRNL
jgi:hypothetical protein